MLPMAPGGAAQGRTSDSGGPSRSQPQRSPGGTAAVPPGQRGGGSAAGAGAAGSPHSLHARGAAQAAQGAAGQGPGGASKRPVALSLAALEVSMGDILTRHHIGPDAELRT